MSRKRPTPSRSAQQRRSQLVAQAVTISAALIVKDEAERLPDCLGALKGVVDEIVVYDTGSADDTVEVAESLGAKVFEGSWPGDFASARNLALAECTGTWVLSVDADEVVAADVARLRVVLGRPAAAAYTVLIHNVVAQGGAHDFDHRGARLFRRRGTQWAGTVHELPSDERGEPIRLADLPGDLLGITHYGYPDEETVARKCVRNAEIMRDEIRRLAALPEPSSADYVGRMLAHLMRSEEGRHAPQAALEVGAVLTEMLPDDDAWPQAVDRLAHVALAHGSPGAALPFAERLRDSGKAPGWAAYLEGETLRRMGRYEQAWRLMERLRPGLVNTVGVHLPDPMLHGAKAMSALGAGEIAAAAVELVEATRNAEPSAVAASLGRDTSLSDEALARLAAALAPRNPALAEAVRGARIPSDS